MPKSVKSFRIEDQMHADLIKIAEQHYGGNVTAAIEEAISYLVLTLSIPEGDRDRIRVSAKRGCFAEVYEEHELKMIDYFLI